MRILDELERLRKDHPDLEQFFREECEEPFFVKNLENVQGDERDVIILGIGYGPDDTGRVAMRFGPLNRQGGQRRLNVAVTRARQHMTVISSMRAHNIDLSRTNAEGPKLLRAYLDYAERGVEALRGTITGVSDRGFDSPFEQEVCDELTRRGLTVHPQVGCSGFRVDLAVVDPAEPGRYLLGVECDGATYHSSATARDRDRLRQEILEGLGWRICRIWSTDWLRDRKGQVRRVLAALQTARREKPPGWRVRQPIVPPPQVIPEITQGQAQPEPTATFDSIDDVPASLLRETICQQLREVGATEAGDLVKAVSRRLGFKRTGSVIQATIEKCLENLIEVGLIARTGDDRLQVTQSTNKVARG
jgi:very-short-patch-repair endonuclease